MNNQANTKEQTLLSPPVDREGMERLKALAAKWRGSAGADRRMARSASQSHRSDAADLLNEQADTLVQCADELDAALSSSAPQEQKALCRYCRQVEDAHPVEDQFVCDKFTPRAPQEREGQAEGTDL